MASIRTLGWRSLALVALILLVVRPVSVFVSTLGQWTELARAFVFVVDPPAGDRRCGGQFAVCSEAQNAGHALAGEAARFELMGTF